MHRNNRHTRSPIKIYQMPISLTALMNKEKEIIVMDSKSNQDTRVLLLRTLTINYLKRTMITASCLQVQTWFSKMGEEEHIKR
jgi:hypothetical protein